MSCQIYMLIPSLKQSTIETKEHNNSKEVHPGIGIPTKMCIKCAPYFNKKKA